MNVGIYIFEDMTMLDGFAPLQFFAFVEEFDTFTFAKTKTPFRADSGATLTADYDLEDCPPIDVLVMPGGGNVLTEMEDEAVQAFLRERGPQAKYVTSVCTGSLILAEAGLLDGYRAATHWSATELLAQYPGVTVVDERVAVDRNRITGGGVTAGIDFALTVIAELVSTERAQAMQLLFEYRPQPPFDSGSPETAPPEVLEGVTRLVQEASPRMLEFVTRERESAA